MPGLEEIVNGEGELVKMLKEKEQRKCKDLFDELLAQLCCTMMDQHKRQQQQQQCQEESTNNSANAPLSIIVPPAMPNWDLFPSPISPSSSPSSAFSSSSFSTGSPAASPNFLQFSSPLSKTLQTLVKKSPAAIKTTVDDPQRPHKCEHCGKAFRFKSNLFEHKSLHYPPAGMANGIGGEGGGNGKSANGANSRQPFVCPFCAKTCRLKGNLKKHLQVHVNSPDDLERLWKRSFSRQSGRPRKNAPHRPLPKPGDDLGLVPLPPLSSASFSSADQRHFTFSNSSPSIGLLQWAFPDQLETGLDEAALC